MLDTGRSVGGLEVSWARSACTSFAASPRQPKSTVRANQAESQNSLFGLGGTAKCDPFRQISSQILSRSASSRQTQPISHKRDQVFIPSVWVALVKGCHMSGLGG